jgi:hypothetical protein
MKQYIISTKVGTENAHNLSIILNVPEGKYYKDTDLDNKRFVSIINNVYEEWMNDESPLPDGAA